jgi:hypothetical protein
VWGSAGTRRATLCGKQPNRKLDGCTATWPDLHRR